MQLKSPRSGFTLIELVVALVLFSVVGTSIYQLLVNNQRVYREQSQRVDANTNVRTALSLLTSELKELNAGDSLDSDIISMASTSITYKAMRNLYVLCQDPNVGAGSVSFFRNPSFGLRELNVGTDSVVIYADNDRTTRMDDRWIHASIGSSSTGTSCPGGAASIDVTLAGISVPGLAAVYNGAPARSFEVVQMLLYQDTRGFGWLGTRRYNKSSGWGSLQPVLGPLQASSGVAFTYYDANGAVTSNRSNVARVKITINGQTAEKVRTPDGSIDYLNIDIETNVALRNNPRF